MSKKIDKEEQIQFQPERGIREIPDTLRRHARMSPKQMRISMIIATALVLLLAGLIILSKNNAASVLRKNESAIILEEAMHAERVELSNKLQLTDRYGTATVDGKHLYVLQQVGQKNGTDADKLYWLVYCQEEEVPLYEKAMSSYKQLIPVDVKDGSGLYLVVSQANKLEETRAKLQKQGIEPHFYSMDTLNGTPDLSEFSEKDQEHFSQLLNETLFYNFSYDDNQSVRLSRGTPAQIAEKDDEKNMLRLIRMGLIALMITAAVFLVVQLKAENRSSKAEMSPKRRKIRIIALIAAGVLLAGVVMTSVMINQKDDELAVINELTIETDISRGIDDSDKTAGDGDSEKFEYLVGNWRNPDTITVSIPENETGLTLWRIIYYASLTLLMILAFAMLYYFRYERDMGFPILNVIILILLMIITLYPVLNTVAYSFNDGTDAARGGIGIWPRQFSLDSYKEILTSKLYTAAGVSAAKTIITTVLNLFWTGMLAFALSRKEYVLRRFITLVMVLTMYVNAGLIPNFLLISRDLGLSDKFLAYIIPTMFSCFNMIIIRTYIMGLPNELVESARIDGAGDFRIYWRIIFPLCAPVRATVALFVAVGAWNSWFDTMLYMPNNRNLDTLQYYLMGKINTAGQQSNLANGSLDAANELAKQSVSPRTVQCATTVVTALPILVIYPFLQRYFVTGMALGSVKG